MNIESIKRIEGSSMWERITAHPLYLGNKILEDGAFKSMYLFFSNKIDTALVTEWSEAGKLMGVNECLDTGVWDTYNKVIRWS